MTAAAPRLANVETVAPTLPLMHFAFVLAGLGTMLLGPILPLLAVRWHLPDDAQAGLIIMAQFCGATLGGASTSARLVRGLGVGLAAACAGLLGFAFAPSLGPASAAILLGGFGIGRTIATVNILAGARYAESRGATLARLNFSWSLGALLSPLLAAWLAPRFPLPNLLAAFALLFLLALATLGWQSRRQITVADQAVGELARLALPRLAFAYFAGLILIYGGLETCLSAWLTTFALRYGRTSLVLSEYMTVLLLLGLTAGRALAAWLLARWPERRVQLIAIACSAVAAATLALVGSAGWIATAAVLLGVCLAPIFPATFALLMSHRPSARQAGVALAASGIGAAALPWSMGVVSTATGSLRTALLLPVAAAVVLFGLALVRLPTALARR